MSKNKKPSDMVSKESELTKLFLLALTSQIGGPERIRTADLLIANEAF